MTLRKIQNALFYTIVFLIPANLGYHFIFKWTYVNGLLTDYLIPVIYLQDILIFLLVVSALPSIFSRFFGKSNATSIWFVSCVFLSCLISVLPQASWAAFFRIFLYFMFMLYVKNNIKFEYVSNTIFKTLAYSVFFLSLLGIMQWLLQKSVFDNYLFFGEQPYTYSTPGINKENFFGFTRVASYGTFRHPNVFGGFLSIVLIWLYANIRKQKLFLLSFGIGVVALIFTLSKTAWLAFVFGLFGYHLIKRGKLLLVSLLSLVFVVTGLLLPYLVNVFSLTSVSLVTRAQLLVASYDMLFSKPTFGYGVNASTSVIQSYLVGGNYFKFAQPVHNIFILVFTELGAVGLSMFISLYLQKLLAARNSFLLLFISLLQFLILGSFDHYLFTMHQMNILFWLILGLV